MEAAGTRSRARAGARTRRAVPAGVAAAARRRSERGARKTAPTSGNAGTARKTTTVTVTVTVTKVASLLRMVAAVATMETMHIRMPTIALPTMVAAMLTITEAALRMAMVMEMEMMVMVMAMAMAMAMAPLRAGGQIATMAKRNILKRKSEREVTVMSATRERARKNTSARRRRARSPRATIGARATIG